MKKRIKAREVVKDIKVHDAAVSVGDKIKNTAIKTKQQVINNEPQPDSASPEQYAADKVTDFAGQGIKTAVYDAERGAKKNVKSAGEAYRNKKNSAEPDAQPDSVQPSDTVSDTAESPVDRTESRNRKGDKNAPDSRKKSADIKQKQQTIPKQRGDTVNETANTDEKKPRQRKQSKPKTRGKQDIKTPKSADKNIKTVDSAGAKIKQTAKSADGKARKSIKTADNTAKNAAKAAEKNAKAAKKSAELAAKTAKKTKETAKVTARATVKTVKTAAKATVAAVKATVAAAKELIAAIIAGGWVAVLVIVIICLIAAIGGTCFGIFLSNDESTGTKMTMTTAISVLTSEYYTQMTVIKNSKTYDVFEVEAPGGDVAINWKDILAVYAVKTTTSADNAAEVVTLNEEKLGILREIMWDMNTMVGIITPKLTAETTTITDTDGNTVTTTSYVTKRVLTVKMTRKSAAEMVDEYSFNADQQAQLAELMSSDYDSLWAELLNGSGQIITTDSTWLGIGIFKWALPDNNSITSPFGTRTDPLTGEVTTHGGIDIAADEGAPILAAADGSVSVAAWGGSDGYGYYVRIRHNDVYSTLYAHCSALLVSVGQAVQQGQVIAYVGSTGRATGPHLHFEVIQNSVRVNPLNFFKQ